MSRGFALLLFLVFLISLVTLQPGTVKAQTKTIIVPDDYPTITDAIGNATDGDTILVRAGVYNETTLDTNMSISLIGEGASVTKITLNPPIVTTTIGGVTLSGYADPIDVNANNVDISGFTITSDGGNIAINGNNEWLTGNVLDVNVGLSGNYETVVNNNLNLPLSPIQGIGIAGSYSQVCENIGIGLIGVGSGSYNSIFDNSVTGEIGGFGTSSSNLFYGNTVKDNSGMSAQTSDIVANNTITNCNHGVSITNGFNNFVYGNTITNNNGAGLIKIDGLNNTFYANYVANNGFGVQIGANGSYTENGVTVPVGNTTFYDNDFINNNQQVQVLVPSVTDNWNYSNQGNYWSDYLPSYPNASQVDSSGIGNTPYFVGDGEQDNYPLMSPFDISSINIQLPSWANITTPNPLPTPSFPPQSLLVSSTPAATPTDSTTASASPTPAVPEFSTWIILPLFAVAILLATVIIRKRIEKE